MSHSITANILSKGLGSWIQYERACKRTETFSESYLTHPIAQLLNSRTQHRVISEFRHPVLAPLVTGRGRRPTTDFVVCDHDNRVYLAIETKWLGRTPPLVKDVLWDLIRLELIRRETGATCFFIMGGKKKDIDALLESEGFIDRKGRGLRRPLLRQDNNICTVKLDSTDVFRRKMLRDIYSNYQRVEFSTRLATQRATPFPEHSGNHDFRVIVWELQNVRDAFLVPANVGHFHINQSAE